jgi:hypothetical protein
MYIWLVVKFCKVSGYEASSFSSSSTLFGVRPICSERCVLLRLLPGWPSNSVSVIYGGGVSTTGYTFTPCVGYFACPGIDLDTRNIGLTWRGNELSEWRSW